jgi:hypothetical protein
MYDPCVSGIDRRIVLALLFVVSASVVTRQAQAQGAEGLRPWWVELQMGYGSTELTSDLGRAGHKGTFTLAFRGGRSFGERLRVGLELGGWLLEAGNIWDPSKGERVSQVAVIAQLRPVVDLPLFVEAGAGLAYYTNNRPLEFGSRGTGWTVGAGWGFSLTRTVHLAPSVNVSGGRLRDIDNVLVSETGLRYSAWDLRLGLTKDFGRTRTERVAP